MAITIEVTRGRYLRHLRDLKGQTIREVTDDINAVLPGDQRVAHSWLHQLELESGKSKMTVLRALALRQVLGADIAHLDVSADDLHAVTALVAEPPIDGPGGGGGGSPDGQVRESSVEAADLHEAQMPRSACMARRRLILSGPACPTTAVHSLPFVPKHRMGSSCAHRQ